MSDATEHAVEKMARALGRCGVIFAPGFRYKMARAALAALMEPTRTVCETCAGTGKVLAHRGVATVAYYEKAPSCPADCTNGYREDPSALDALGAQYEQVESYDQTGHEPLYRRIPLEAQ